MQGMEPTTKETYQLINNRLDALEEKLRGEVATSEALKQHQTTLIDEIKALREELADCKKLYFKDWTGQKVEISFDITLSGMVMQTIEIIVDDVSPTDIREGLNTGTYLTTVMDDHPQIVRNDGLHLTPVANIISQKVKEVDELEITSAHGLVLKDG